MYHETNHVEENNEPKNEKMKSSGKVGLCALPKVTHSQILESHKKYGNMNGPTTTPISRAKDGARSMRKT
jgi:hypothetical protein